MVSDPFDCNGCQYVIKTFKKPHDKEYVLYEAKEGKIKGKAQLFKRGILQLSWEEEEGNEDSAITIYSDGIVKVATTRYSLMRDSLSQDEVRLLVNDQQTKPVMEIIRDGVVRYRGDFDLNMNKSGCGVEFDERGVEEVHAFYKDDKPFHIFREFDYLRPDDGVVQSLHSSSTSSPSETTSSTAQKGLEEDNEDKQEEENLQVNITKSAKRDVDEEEEFKKKQFESGEKKVMIEYSGDDEDENADSLVKLCPIYIGEYSKDDSSEVIVFQRHGEGKTIDELTGICIRVSHWENGVEVEDDGYDLYNGWYHKYKSETSIRESIADEKAVEKKKQREERIQQEKRKKLMEEDVDICPELKLVQKRGVLKWEVESSKFNETPGDMTKVKVSLTDFPQLQSITIASSSLRNVRNFILDGLSCLEKVDIQANCFSTQGSAQAYKSKYGLCKITNCCKLKTLVFGNCSFCDYSQLELSNVDNLETISFGSYCFTSSDCILKSIDIIFFFLHRSSCIEKSHFLFLFIL